MEDEYKDAGNRSQYMKTMPKRNGKKYKLEDSAKREG